ncbi:DMT family transporter [Yimella sp. RIT 621]|uniref:DMT family transporter n=1 Tax=Yimella sp. RIT 621 TaxID=2510323 RepID=UPI00101D95C1|nr:DMT family transporter [Yimella sp. RIT 621]RYG78882.1 DMT family transporter [Yimella sp. RIT 621]
MVALLALGSSLVWGTSDFAGGLFAKRIAAVRVVAVAQIGGLLTMCVVLGVRVAQGVAIADGPWHLYGALAGLTGAVGLVCFYAALSMGTMGVVSPIASMGAVVPVAAGLATGDRIGVAVGIGLALMLFGVVLASGPELGGGAGRTPVLLAFVAAVAFGLSLFCMDRAAEVDVIPALWAMRIASVSALLLAWRFWPGGPVGARVPRRDVPMIMLVGVGDLAANALFSFAAAQGMVSVVSVLGSLYPVVTLIWARVLLDERLRPVQVAGVAATLGGIALVVG